MTLPPPLTPPECDLRDFGFMPLDVRRFRDSDLVAFEEPEAIVAAVMLWAAAWHNVPAASLTDDDRALAQLAGYGRSVKSFQKVRAGALRGFVKCSDGRLYHPVVAAKARESWKGKLKQRWNTECARIRKHNERNQNDKISAPTFEQWLQNATPTPIDQGNLPLSEGGDTVRPRTRTVASTVPEKSPLDVARDEDQSHANVARDKGSKGESRERERETLEEGLIESPQTPLAVLTAELASAAGIPLASDRARTAAEAQVKAWLDAGIERPTMIGAIQKFTAHTKSPSRSLARFDSEIRLLHAKQRKTPPPRHVGPALDADDDDPRIASLRETLRKVAGARSYDGWLKPGRFTINGSGLILTMPTRFMADWAVTNFGAAIGEASEQLGLGRVTIKAP